MSGVSASEYLSHQQELEDDARKLMPWDPKSCTYEKGALRQQVFACRSHGKIGVCYSCSIQCHTKCDIVELFTKDALRAIAELKGTRKKVRLSSNAS